MKDILEQRKKYAGMRPIAAALVANDAKFEAAMNVGAKSVLLGLNVEQATLCAAMLSTLDIATACEGGVYLPATISWAAHFCKESPLMLWRIWLLLGLDADEIELLPHGIVRVREVNWEVVDYARQHAHEVPGDWRFPSDRQANSFTAVRDNHVEEAFATLFKMHPIFTRLEEATAEFASTTEAV